MTPTPTPRKLLAVLLTLVTFTSAVTAGVTFWTDPVAAHGDHQDGGGAEGTNQWATDSNAFRVETVVSGLQFPTEAVFLPDGRMLVIEQGGRVVIYDPSSGRQGIYLQLSDVDSDRERGLIGITLDPNFEQNGYLYLYYARQSQPENVLSRFTHDQRSGGVTSRAGSERVLWRNEIRVGKSRVCCHFGGGLDIGSDGKIYLTTGDEFQGSRAQDLSVPDGKVIRLNRDGSIPGDNPYASDGDPNTLGEIWASGLRNPYRATVDDATGRLYIGEVGGNVEPSSQEDIHLGRKGANYGWPNCEGMCSNAAYDDPIYTYSHGESGGREGAAVTVGPVYRGGMYPAEYNGALFYSDYNDGWIKYLVLRSDGTVRASYNFEPNAGAVVASTVGPDGALYTVNYAAGQVRRYVYDGGGNAAPVVQSATGTPTGGSPPLTVDFSASATDADGDALTYAWRFGDGDTATGRQVSHTYRNSGTYDAVVEVSDGSVTVQSQPIEIRVGSGPSAEITAPADGSTFRAGDTLTVRGSATDPDDGQLTGSSLQWNVRFTHNEHFHPEFETTGESFSFEVPTTGHAFTGNTGYEITLTATDSDGITATDAVRLVPEEVDVTLRTDPDGLGVTLDQIPRSTAGGGYTFDSAIGFEHDVEAPVSVCQAGTTYEFVRWSDGANRVRTLTVPAADVTLTAEYAAAGACDVRTTNGLVAQYDADTGVRTGANGVTQWVDQSGNGNDLTAVGAPQYIADGANGAGAVRFDGQDDELVRTAATTGLPAGSSDRTVFVVANYRATSGFGGFAYGTPARNRAFGLVVSDTGALTLQGWGRANDFQSGTAGVGAGWLVQSVVYGNGQFTHYANGQQIDAGSHTFATTTERIVLGAELNGNDHVDMDVAAVYVYDGALSDTERRQVEAALTARYLDGAGGGTGGTTDAPPVASDDSITVDPGASVDVAVLGNDADDVGLDASSVRVVTGPSSGTATANADGTVTYRHDGSATTGDSFTYRVSDTAGQESNTARVSVTVRSDGDTGTGGSSDVPVSNGLVAHFE
ncbi:PQQ-dependent sugar dehydrogenase, partial [Halogeometricum limi]